MIPQKEKSIGDILGGMKPSEETGSDAEERDEGDEEGKRLSDAIFDALKAGDRDAFHEAQEAYMAYCMGEEPEDVEEASDGDKAEPKKGIAIVLGH